MWNVALSLWGKSAPMKDYENKPLGQYFNFGVTDKIFLHAVCGFEKWAFFTFRTHIMHLRQWKRGSCCSSRLELKFMMHSFIPQSIGDLLLTYCSVFNLSDAGLNRLQLTPIGEQPPSLHWVNATPPMQSIKGAFQTSPHLPACMLIFLLARHHTSGCPRKTNGANVFRTDTERAGLKGFL